MTKRKIVVVGAGPVGSLAALYAANRGDDVEVYDLRKDLRKAGTTPLNFTKSINLALSERGINAIRSTGQPSLLDTVLQETIPMHGRMIHTTSSTGRLQEQPQAYDVHGRFQRSVDRDKLNRVLLNELEKMSNVKMFFQHKLTGADFRKKQAWFEVLNEKESDSRSRAPEIDITFDLMIGADGAHSATRHHLMKYARMDYQQEYIDCLWCEFTMPPSESNQFRIPENYLHIWPAGKFMFIALPNIDRSFVCTLFGPASLFTQLEAGSESTIVEIFDKYFPGVTKHIKPEDLYQQFQQNPHLPLIHIKCSPHHYNDSVVILGDAANAMVPFYGQGMNAGLESVRVLFSKLDATTTTADALASYTEDRTPDAHAVAGLSLANYIEMRSSVTSRIYKLRKFIEEKLDEYFPSLGWATQYSRVSFSNMRYTEVIEKANKQKQILMTVLVLAMATSLAVPGRKFFFYILRLYASYRSNRQVV